MVGAVALKESSDTEENLTVASAGYIQTELGVIPNNWEVRELGKIATVTRGASPRPISDPGWFDEKSKVGWVRISDVTKSNMFLHETTQKLSQAGILKSRPVDKNSLIMSICATVGRPIITMIDTCIHDGFVVFQSPKVDKKYLYYSLQNIESDWSKHGQTGSQMNLNTTLINSTKIRVPSKHGEQEAIANALSDADEWIFSLESLIEKKKKIKAGAMQSLLSGEKRLKGFDKKWERKPLDEISTLKGRIGWQGLKQTEFTQNPDQPYLITGMNFKDGAIRWDEVYHISEERYGIAPEIQLRPDDVLMTKDGTIGKVLFIDNIPYPHKASLNSHLLVFRPINEAYYPKYLYYQFQSDDFFNFIEKNKYGTTFFGISQAAISTYSPFMPDREEQIAIANILSDMDRELSELDEKLEKAKSIKQGMMQVLLTGKVRLV
ncbi:MAG: restriction endonuclease subunit S [Pseudomonadota bacterium]